LICFALNDDGSKFFILGFSYVAAVDPHTSSSLWNCSLQGPLSDCILNGQTMVCGAYGSLYAIDLTNGHLSWSFGNWEYKVIPLALSLSSSETESSASPMLFTQSDQQIHVVDGWSVNGNTLVHLWSFNASFFDMSAVYDSVNGMLFVFSMDMTFVQAYETSGGKLVWQFDVSPAYYVASVALGSPDSVLVMDSNGYLSGLARSSGKSLWHFRAGLADGTVAVDVNNVAFVIDNPTTVQAVLTAVDAKTGVTLLSTQISNIMGCTQLILASNQTAWALCFKIDPYIPSIIQSI